MKQNLARGLGITLLVAGTAFGQAAKHPFTAHDWATLRSARATAVSPDGTILYHLTIAQSDCDARWTDEDPEAFRKFSAVAYANKVTTPLLILHGEADQRVPTFQGTEYFQILAARGKTVCLVTYPGSPHFPLLWEQRLNVMQELTDWLARYNKNEPR
jgi:dipeptidyl aminopeptidase/acylaminoacyl peptidase